VDNFVVLGLFLFKCSFLFHLDTLINTYLNEQFYECFEVNYMTDPSNVIINSFRGGTGKTTMTSNLATYLALHGFKVVIIDADVISPGIHAVFGLDEHSFDDTLTDYLLGECDLSDALYDISDEVGLPDESLYLMPSSIRTEDIAGILDKKSASISKAINHLMERIEPDFVLIDTHPGINKSVLSTLHATDVILNVIRPDNQDYQGVKVYSDIIKKLGLQSKTFLLLNKVHPKLRTKRLSNKVEKDFHLPVAGMMPLSEELILNQSRHVFIDKHSDDELISEMDKIVHKIFGIKHKKYMHVVHDFLKVACAKKSVKLSDFKNNKNLKAHMFDKYLHKVVQDKYLKKSKDNTYSITKKGKDFLENFKTICDFEDDFMV
jgi:MinD-like ATPase involved in chromosome partitioning or flagellar assembly